MSTQVIAKNSQSHMILTTITSCRRGSRFGGKKIDSKRRMRFAVCLLAVLATVNWLSSAELTKTERDKLCSRSRDGCKSKHEDLSLCSN